MTKAQVLCGGLLFAIFALIAHAGTLTEQMDIGCAQNTSLELNCSYRLLGAEELSSAVAELNGVVVEGLIAERYPTAGDTTAILMLVDTDPAGNSWSRSEVIKR